MIAPIDGWDGSSPKIRISPLVGGCSKGKFCVIHFYRNVSRYQIDDSNFHRCLFSSIMNETDFLDVSTIVTVSLTSDV